MIAVNTLETQLGPIRDRALIAGGLGAVLCALGAWHDFNGFLQSYLMGVMFWIWISLGCLVLMLIHNVTGGLWGHVTRRMTESGARTFPLLAVLFLPVLLGAGHIYAWSDPQALAKHHIHLHASKQAYLSLPFWALRSLIYFGVWSALGAVMTGWSRASDTSGDPAPQESAERWSGPGLAVVVISSTFAGMDWLMSLEPGWVSAAYGVIFGVSGLLAGHAFVLVFLRRLVMVPGLEKSISPGQLNDLGNFLLGFVMFWTYVTFAQFLIIYSGNIVEEVTYFVARSSGGWLTIAEVLAALGFVIPFGLLLSPSNKRDLTVLSRIATLVLLSRAIDMLFLVAPVFRKEFAVAATDLAALMAVGGFWVWLFVQGLLDRPLRSTPAEGGAAHG